MTSVQESSFLELIVNNFEFVGEHKGGYTPFKLEITKTLKYEQENLLVLYVDSHEREEILPFGFMVDYLTYGGIYKEGRLEYVNEISNDLLIGNFYPAKELYPLLPHAPVIEDIYIGNKIHDNENFNRCFKGILKIELKNHTKEIVCMILFFIG
jgi:hypothetical protein